MTQPPKLVVDSDIFIATARSSSGAASQLLGLPITKEILISPKLLGEIQHSLSEKRSYFSMTEKEIEFFLGNIMEKFTMVHDAPTVQPFTRDVKDDYLASLAFVHEVDYIVTNNGKDFEPFYGYNGILVVTAAGMLRILKDKYGIIP